jgi:RimJ/RimL family protein N-acetyltransferase
MTHTVHLRPMTPSDTPKIVAWRNQDFVQKNFIYQEPFTEEGHLAWIKNQVEPGHVVQFIICLDDGREIGSVYFRDIDREKKTAEYGIFIGEEAAIGCGYGTQTAKLALAYAFGAMEMDRIFLRFLSENTGARISYEHAGFRLIPDRQETVQLRQGACQVLFMEIDRKRWEKEYEKND